MFTYTYKDEFGNEVTISISQEIHQIVEDEPLFERRIKDEYKKHITDLPDGRYEALPSPEDIEESVVIRAGLQDVFDIVNQCTYKQRRRFLLYVVHELTQEEIANLEGCSKQSVQQSVQQVLSKILNSL